jgi:sterol desaturase/sphingolipid hydroxylase (fatty acid hydroxylase superfamily)
MKWMSGALAASALAVLYLLENRRPLRRQVASKEIETVRNLALAGAAGLVLNYLEKPVTGKLTKLVEEKDLGLLKTFRLPKFIETAAAVLLLDYTLYLWHVLTHKLPFLWRFHRVHHADLDLTASTAVRFHFGEIAVSVLFRAGQILFIGVSPEALKLWQNLLFASIIFHHSNLRLPENVETTLQSFVMTPRLHGIHHSSEDAEMNSNWSSGLTLWDFLHGTFRNDVAQNEIVIGVKGFNADQNVTITKMLLTPIQKVGNARLLPANAAESSVKTIQFLKSRIKARVLSVFANALQAGCLRSRL